MTNTTKGILEGKHLQPRKAARHTTWGLALLGQDVVTSAVARYQLRFRLDVNNLALVLTFNFKNNIGLQLSADVFQISQQRQALFVGSNAVGQFIKCKT